MCSQQERRSGFRSIIPSSYSFNIIPVKLFRDAKIILKKIWTLRIIKGKREQQKRIIHVALVFTINVMYIKRAESELTNKNMNKMRKI